MVRAVTFVWGAILAVAFLYIYPPKAAGVVSLAGAAWQWDVFLVTWTKHLLAAAFLAAWGGALVAWGSPAVELIGRLKFLPGLRVLVKAGLGFAGMGFLVLGLGLSGLLFPRLLAGAVILPVLILRPWRFRLAGRLRKQFHVPIWAFAATVPLLAALPGMLSPESSWDAVVYHLRLPELYLIEHRIYFAYDSPFAGFPCLTEMHYLLGLAVSGLERLPKLQHAACWLATARIIFLAARPISIPVAYAAASAWTCTPLGIHLAGMAYIDLASGFMVALCAVILLGETARFEPKRALVAGLFAGFAFSTKYTGGIAVAGTLAYLAGLGGISAGFGGTLLAAAVPAFPWVARNYLSVGNPTYPFFAGIFGGQATAPLEYELAHPASLLSGFAEQGARLFGLAFKDGGGVEAVMGPLWLAVFVPAFAFGRANRLWRFFAAAFLCWELLPLNCRFLLPFIPAAYLAALPAWREISLRPAFLLAMAVLCPLGVWHGIGSTAKQYDSWPPALGLRSYDRHMSMGMVPEPEYWRGVKETNRRLGRNGRLLFLGGIKSYGFQMRASVSHQTHNAIPLLRFVRRAQSAERLAILMRQEGFTHLAYLPRALDGFLLSFNPEVTDREADVLVRWLRIGTRFEFRTNEFILYSLRKPSAPRKLGRVPLLEEAAIIAIRDPENEIRARAKLQLLRAAPDSSSAALLQGIQILKDSPFNAGSGLRWLKRAIESIDACPLAWRGIGFVMLQRGDLPAALANFGKAADLSPSDAEIRFDLGKALLQAGYPGPAAVNLAKAARLAPDRPEIVRALAAARAALR